MGKAKFEPVATNVAGGDRSARVRSVYKNLFVLSFSFMFIMTAFMSLQSLQSSLNREAGLGVISLSCIYGGALFSCMFAPVILKKIGPKWCLSAGWVTHCLFTASNFWPRMYTLIPAGLILGLGTGLIWTSQGVYLTTIAISFAKITGETEQTTMSRFNGIFFMIFQSTQIWGNLISSLILHQGGAGDDAAHNTAQSNSTTSIPIIVDSFKNLTSQNNNSYNILPDILYNATTTTTLNPDIWPQGFEEPSRCGANFCPFEQTTNGTAFKEPARSLVYTLMGIFLGCGVVGTLLTMFFLARLPKKTADEEDEDADQTLCERLSSTFRLMFRDLRMPLLAALCFWTGTEQALMYGDFTQAFIGCELGVGMVGYIMICLGVCNASCAFLLGRLEKYTGRPALFVSATVINVALMLTMLMWQPNKQQLYMFFLIPALWGACDAVWQSQTSSLLGVLFSSNKEAAFANFRLWQNLAQTISFATSGQLCMSVKVIIGIVLACISLALYIIVEVREKIKSRSSHRSDRNKDGYLKPVDQELADMKKI